MKRKAILIEASDVYGQKDLPGARVDIVNWKIFLKSDLGGSWNDDEITIHRKPKSSDLAYALCCEKDCYCLVAFSGHGSDGSVVLNDSTHSHPISGLKPSSSRGTVIVDSCRGISEARSYNFSAANAVIGEQRAVQAKGRLICNYGGDAQTRQYLSSIRHRGLWNDSVIGCQAGIVEMLACAKGQEAGEDSSAGGYYTSLLLDSVEKWAVTSRVNSIHTTKDAHDYAAIKLTSLQNPEYQPSWLKFPFAIKVQ